MIKKGLRLLAPLAAAALFTPVAHAGDIPPMPQAYPISNLYKSCSAAGDNAEREWRFAETGRRYMSDGTLQFKNTTNQEVPYTCLLYTSPSPRDKRQSRMPSSA